MSIYVEMQIKTMYMGLMLKMDFVIVPGRAFKTGFSLETITYIRLISYLGHMWCFQLGIILNHPYGTK